MIEVVEGTGAPVGEPGPASPATSEPVDIRYRNDIDGLRAIAIVVVVIYHAGLPLFSGGFSAVDVFFVISGYLITRNLMAETASTGRIAPLRFWARRIRRLVPALSAMVFTVLIVSVFVYSSLEWQEVARQARAAVLYVSNIFFANQATDYFGASVTSSPYLHTWSLAVEEQFYLLWPLLLAAIALFTARRRERLRPALVAVFVLLFATSFALCISLSLQGSVFAFYGLPSRAWEFAAAGLLALAPVPRFVGRRWGSVLLASAGLALIFSGLLFLNEETVYPTAWPLIPVTGTVLVILAGSSRLAGEGGNVVSRMLGARPCRAIAHVSYSWYLWHWPFIVLTVAALGTDSHWVTSAAAIASLGFAALTYRFFENPIRFAKVFARSLPRTYVMGAAATMLVLIASVGVVRYSDVELAEVASASSSTPSVSLADVRASKSTFTCQQETTAANGATYCLDGDLEGDRTVMVIGDSHARHWKPAFAEAARARGIRLAIRWKVLCPAFPVRTVMLSGAGEDVECQSFRTDTAGIIDEIEPDAIVTSNSNDYGLLVIGDIPRPDDAERGELWRVAYAGFAESVRDRGMRFGSIVDTPRMPSDPLDCVAEKGVDACAAPAAPVLEVGDNYAEAEATTREQLGPTPVLDINSTLCNDQVCPVVINGTYVYVDKDHLYEPFVLTQVPAVEDFLDRLFAS